MGSAAHRCMAYILLLLSLLASFGESLCLRRSAVKNHIACHQVFQEIDLGPV